MEEDPENGKESLNSARANGMNEWIVSVTIHLYQHMHITEIKSRT